MSKISTKRPVLGTSLRNVPLKANETALFAIGGFGLTESLVLSSNVKIEVFKDVIAVIVMFFLELRFTP